jgi:hypothetical protein
VPFRLENRLQPESFLLFLQLGEPPQLSTVEGKLVLADRGWQLSLTHHLDHQLLKPWLSRLDAPWDGISGYWQGDWQLEFDNPLYPKRADIEMQQTMSFNMASLAEERLDLVVGLDVQLQDRQLDLVLHSPQLAKITHVAPLVSLWGGLPEVLQGEMPMHWQLGLAQPWRAQVTLPEDSLWQSFRHLRLQDSLESLVKGRLEGMMEGMSVSPLQLELIGKQGERQWWLHSQIEVPAYPPLQMQLDFQAAMDLTLPGYPDQLEAVAWGTLTRTERGWQWTPGAPLKVSWPYWQLPGNAHLELNAGQIQVDFTQPLQLPYPFEQKMSGQFNLRGQLETAARQQRTVLFQTQWTVDQQQVRLVDWQAEAGALRLWGELNYRLDHGLGDLSWRFEHPSIYADLASFFPVIADQLELASSEAQGKGRLVWRTGTVIRYRADMALKLNNWRGDFRGWPLEGVSLEAQLSLDDQKVLRGNQTALAVESFYPGLVLEQISARFSWAVPLQAVNQLAVEVEALRAQVFSGRLVSQKAVTVRPFQLDSLFEIGFEGIELSDLLGMAEQPLRGKALLDGWIPLQLTRDGVKVDGGRLDARAPGGWLRLVRPPDAQGSAAASHGLELALDVLENYQFNRLSGDFDYTESGLLLIDLQLQGANPDFNKGQPIHLNISLEHDVRALLQSLQITDTINRTIIEGFQ